MLQSDKSPGPDGLHPHLLKSCAQALAKPLSLIFRCSYETGTLPTDWKLAHISPVFKKGSKSDPSNYRPISLTSVPCKLMESILKDRIVSFIESGDGFNKFQHGFIKGKSCLTNLLETFEAWTTALDDGYDVDMVYLDYRKAFDAVPHARLLHKLATFRIDSHLLAWIKNFLLSRHIRVCVRKSSSGWVLVVSGVPQGSVIGPLLFILYVDDLPDTIKNSIRMFADDTKIWAVVKSDQDVTSLQSDLDELAKWSDMWLLSFNIDKCKVMHLGHRAPASYYLQEGPVRKLIQTVTEERDLGVHVKSDLKPSLHCGRAAAKASSTLGLIRRHFKHIDKESFLILYKAYIRPHLEYCVQSWSPSLVKDITCLKQIQRRATKMVDSLCKLSYSERLSSLGLTTLATRRLRGDLIETYKILTHKKRTDPSQFFSFNDSGYALRGHSLKLYKPSVRLNVRKHFYSYRVIDSLNQLPQHVVEAPTVNAFKNRLDKHWRCHSNWTSYLNIDADN